MKTIKQLLRQPIKSLFGVTLVAIAVAALCVCLGQQLASYRTREKLDEIYMTAAFAKSGAHSQWLEAYAEEHPEGVKAVSHTGLASAYIPDLTIHNWTSYWHKPLTVNPNMCAPYDTAVLEITLTEINEADQRHTYAKNEDGSYAVDENGQLIPLEYPGDNVVVNLTGTVERAIALEAGYPDPTGFTARLVLSMPSREALEELDLTVGERYLVYGTNYVDLDWELRHNVAALMSWNKDTALPEWDLDTFEGIRNYSCYEMDGITYYSYWIYNEQGEAEELISTDNLEDVPVVSFKCKIGDLYHGMELRELNQFRSVSMSCGSDGSMPEVRIYQTEDGTWVCEQIQERSYLDENGQAVSVTLEEYAQRYREPVIVHLTGSAEEFLAGKEGALWAEALDNIQVNNHAFAFLGVDKLSYVENFDAGIAKIVTGRDFTREELENGARVCIISKQLAQANGLTVGDTIEPRFYDPDLSLPYQLSVSSNTMLPKPLYYFGNTTLLQEAEPYTIVGIYEQEDPAPAVIDSMGKPGNSYGFTANTIFAPKASITAAMVFSDSWLFKTVVLENGQLDTFQLAAIEAGFGEGFSYTDNGYELVEGSLLSYQENAGRAAVTGVSVYGIITALFLLLFPLQQRGALTTMESLGAGRGRGMRFLLSGSFGILLPGSVLGTGAGMLLWQKVVELLAEGSQRELGIGLDVSAIAAIGFGQMLLVLTLVALLGIPMTRKRSLMRRK